MSRKIIATASAPAAIGPYSQAVQAGGTVYLSGQIGLDPATMQMAEGIDAQIARVFDNLKAVAAAASSVICWADSNSWLPVARAKLSCSWATR